ncbi:3704_t:CDS:2 [Dentiscutata erythropus]|uniref:3704_t:CDS:1 n=1 Tax=Dentiscutata erythropus TaxID=1348616 RepID=A0A9N9BE95_9GLOM|nr:3704_t:CDS:2 [Dentiscutata erythropus]
MRYTKARLTKFGTYLLEDLAFETIKWIDNYDETEKEPKILPANLNLLLNGSSGIAVGMSTNIPPHNLGEVVDVAINLIQEPEISWRESNSLSSSSRRNNDRTIPSVVDIKRKIIDRKGDMLIHRVTIEFECAETGRWFEEQNGTKLLLERGIKMPKILKDMFN